MTRIQKAIAVAAAVGGLAWASFASAQVPFPPNWANGPVGLYRQDVFPYPGQCYTGAAIGSLPQCTLTNAPSFKCESFTGTISNQTSASWGACNSVTTAPVLLPINPKTQIKFGWEVLNPLDYTPDTLTYPGAHYYEIGIHESWGFQAIATAGTALGIELFPDAQRGKIGNIDPAGSPNGKQWTGLICPQDGSGVTCTPNNPLYTPIHGVGQINMNGGPITFTLNGNNALNAVLFNPATQPLTAYSANKYVATWPSISIRGTKGTPVVVNWVNEFPNNHLFCPHPEAADWPCSIDRTFMGVKATVEPSTTAGLTNPIVPWDRLNQFGSPQQPDNSWVTHLHGGEIPPQTDGFAEKWYGNRVTAPVYTGGVEREIAPMFNAPFDPVTQNRTIDLIKRPAGFSDVYAYPMVNEESTIWFHDHTLGKTHHNVVAGPAGFFPVKDPSKHKPMTNGLCTGATNLDCEYTWIDPVTEPRGALGIPDYDLFLAIQDRSFSNDGSINFPSNMSYVPAVPLPGQSTFAPGDNVQVHPVWQPEYFGDHALVNGVLWPKKTVAKGWYRVRVVDGSDSRCYTIGFGTIEPAYATATVAAPNPVRNVRFNVIANDQGYLPKPILNQTSFTMCPGERYELLIDFSQKTLAVALGNLSFPAGLPAALLGSGPNFNSVFMNNTATAPFPVGQSPQQSVPGVGSPFSELASIMKFDIAGGVGGVVPVNAAPPPVLTCPGTTGTTWPVAAGTVGCMRIPAITDFDFVNARNLLFCPRLPSGAPDLTSNGGLCIAAERQLYLNERLDGATAFPLGMQINGVPFEYNVTETPKKGTWETWKIINLTADTHPMHPHLVKALIVSRQSFNKGAYLTKLCGTSTCTPGTAPGGMMQLTPDVTPFLSLAVPALPAAFEAGWKDALQTPPNRVTTIIAKWDGGWTSSTSPTGADITAPGAGNPTGTVGTNALSWVYPDVTSGPYVWHCHINSHEDSEMMRSSLVVK